ncbi:MAG: YciK family oxidoreductase [Halochromatium sp.]|uniref:YciK family oxidoreductase n=1 Tax=Halochromatium sp. TaxID=2049430 RepID=UPI00397E290B
MQDYQPRPDLLHDRVILITGAAEGIGRALALACAKHGATVVLSGFREKALEAVYDQIVAAGWPEPASLPLNLEKADEPLMLGIATTLGDEFGRLDGLAHTAQYIPFLSRIDDYDAEQWEKVLRINLTAPFLLTQACLPLLRAAEAGSVLFQSDRVGRRALAYWGAFAAAMSGIEALMQTLAEETEGNSRIRVNSIDPGAVRTAQRRELYPAEDPNTLPTADSIVNAYLYLLGPDSRGLSGQALSAQTPGAPPRPA